MPFVKVAPVWRAGEKPMKTGVQTVAAAGGWGARLAVAGAPLPQPCSRLLRGHARTTDVGFRCVTDYAFKSHARDSGVTVRADT